MQVKSRHLSLVALACFLSMSLGCKNPPRYFGRSWCFVPDENVIGRDNEDQFGSVHIDGEPYRACFCLCDDLHADTILFTSDDPPEPNEAWIEVMELIRSTAIRECEERAAELGFVEDNCAEVMPAPRPSTKTRPSASATPRRWGPTAPKPTTRPMRTRLRRASRPAPRPVTLGFTIASEREAQECSRVASKRSSGNRSSVLLKFHLFGARYTRSSWPST